MRSAIVFYDERLPFAGARPGDTALASFPPGFRIAGLDELPSALEKADCLINLHGPYFPKGAWAAILHFLEEGGALLHLGGKPFRIPVREAEGAVVAERKQTAYHQQLRIHEILRVDPAPIARYAASEEYPLLRGREELFSVQETDGFVLHATRADDRVGEGGTSGPMDAHIHALLKGISPEGREVAAPIVLIENVKGAFAGGRWVFANLLPEARFWEQGGVEALVEWAAFARQGVTELWLKPGAAVYEPGEQARLMLQGQRLARRGETAGKPEIRWEFRLQLFRHSGTTREQIGEERFALPITRELSIVRIPAPSAVEAGQYTLECRAESEKGETRLLLQGYWGMDKALLEQGEPLRCGRDYFRKNGRPMPVVGMTYMGSDVGRKFLFLPNVALWDRDMARMKEAGVNLIRTGIWTAWRQVMFVDGHPYEEVLRAIDAFILTAVKHGMEVTFTFFSFVPEAWEGVNPYLDPRSVEAQKRFVAAIVSRHATTANVHWDLINEPSLFDPARIFSGPATAGDEFERTRFAEWLEKRHGTIAALQERWDMTPRQLPDFRSARLPDITDVNFRTTPILPKKSGPWLDYALFTMDMHNRWIEEMTSAIRACGGRQPVTVGQDEALSAQRPSPHFYAEAVDYTTMHSWWLMDHLVWDGIFAKTPDKPCLVQETGIMYVETGNGFAKRTEKELRSILERKYAYAFATGGAGAVQWIWNTNSYMNNVNESNIGALRADGSEKPEADVSYRFGQFMASIGDLFEDREPEEICVVYPYANDFSTRKLAFDATAKLTRTLAYEMKTAFRAAGEYHLEQLAGDPAKLIIVPGAHQFSDGAMDKLVRWMERQGGTLLVTGALGLDEYGAPTSRLQELTGARRIRNALREEALSLNGRLYPVSFGGERIAQLSLETPPTAGEGAAGVHVIPVGRGRLIWCPLPVELNDRTEPIAALYRYALDAAGVRPELLWLQGGDEPGVYGRKLAFPRGVLFVFVSESSRRIPVKVEDPANGAVYSFELDSERAVLFAVDGNGAIRSVYRPDEVAVLSST